MAFMTFSRFWMPPSLSILACSAISLAILPPLTDVAFNVFMSLASNFPLLRCLVILEGIFADCPT